MLAIAGPARAEPPPATLSFEAAQARLAGTSATLRASDSGVRAAEEQAAALTTLRRPAVSIDAQLLHYEKTLDISLSNAWDQAESAAGQILPGLIGELPGIPGEILQAINDRLKTAIPELFAGLPDSVRLHTADTSFRPVATAVMPIYTGGAIPALRDTAGAGVELARARAAEARNLETVNLARLYFGQELTRQSVEIARETRDGFDLHLSNARKMERQGFLSTAQRLQVEVARDAAQRQLDRAELEHDTARQSLAILLDSAVPIGTSTALFVNRTPLPPAQQFVAKGVEEHPRIAEAAAGVDAAKAGVDLARSTLRPSAYAFGAYNLNRGDALPTEPDWAVGVGVRYTFLSPVDRRRMLGAAKSRAGAAEALQTKARDDTSTLIVLTWNVVELARRQFLSLDSSLAATRENLRVQEIAFREGQAPVSELVDARNLLGAARLQRAAAAYEYDLSLAALLAASGDAGSFAQHLNRADRVIAQ